MLKPAVLSALKIGIAVYSGLCVLLFLRQSRLLYFPTTEIAQTPADVGLAYEDLTLATPDGQRLGAWYVPADSARGTVLMCHGNGGNISHRLEALQFLHGLHVNVLIFDYRGYGRSTGSPSETGTYTDAMAAWSYLAEQRRVPPAQIVLFGRSLGGAVASWLAEQRPPAGLILEATFTSVPDMGAKLYPWLPVRLLCRFRYNTLARLPKLRCPLLIAHSPADDLIPYPHGQRLFAAAHEPKRFVQLAGGHNDGEVIFAPSYRQALDSFLSDCLKGLGDEVEQRAEP